MRLRDGHLASPRAEIFWLLALGAVLLDSLAVYLLRTLTGRVWPVNFMAALLLVVGWAAFGLKDVVPKWGAAIGLFLCALGFASGIVLLEELTAYRSIELCGGLVAFMIGFAAIRHARATNLAMLLTSVGALYVLVCVVALWGLAPALFPVIEAVGMANGDLIVRPEVTIDQNFQIYYLFLVALPLALPQRFVRSTATFVLILGAALVLARLQTRSGILLLAGVLLAAWAMLGWQRAGPPKRLWLLPVLVAAFVVMYADVALQAAGPLVRRFADGDFTTLHGRIGSAGYFFERLLRPEYWVPQGNSEFLRLGGDVPHFNPAAFLLEGGLIAVVGWILVQLVPLCRVMMQVAGRRADAVATLVFLGGVVSFVASLSLNAPHFKQVWLWAGAVVAVLARTSSGEMKNYEQPSDRVHTFRPANLLP